MFSTSCGVLDFVDYMMDEEDAGYWDEESDDRDDDVDPFNLQNGEIPNIDVSG